ncbi:MAG: YfhO family protein [Actinobacteria bacterium]|nr:YfhO family protein [Actinomycetota bacterium]
MRRRLSRAIRWFAVHPFITCLLWALWLSALYGIFGPHSYVRVFDNADGGLAARAGMNLWLAGWDALAIWAHGWVAGLDRGIPDLDLLPFLVLPGWLAYWLVMFVQRFVAAYFSFRLARDHWKLDTSAAWFLALWYSLFFQTAINGSWAGFTLYDGLTLAAVPAIVWVLLAKNKPLWRLLLVAGATGVLYAWTSMYAFAAFILLLIPVLLAVSGGRNAGKWLAFAVFAATWLVAELPAILAGALNAAASHRADRDVFLSANLSEIDQVLLALRILRDNIVGLAIGLWASIRCNDRRSLPYLIASAVAIVAVALAHWGDAVLNTIGGPLAHFTFERIYFWIPFLAASAGAYGLNALRTSAVKAARVFTIAGLGAVIALSAWVNLSLAANTIQGSNYTAVLADPAVKALRLEADGSSPFRVGTVVSGKAGYGPPQPAYVWAQNVETIDGYSSLYSQRYQDFWERVIGPLIAVDYKCYAYFHHWGNRVYLFEPTASFSEGPVRVGQYYNLDLLAFANVRYLLSGVELEDVRLHEVSRPDIEPSSEHESFMRRNLDRLKTWLRQLTNREDSSRLYVYELEGTLPRAFIVGSTHTFESEEDLLDALAAAPLEELGRTAFIEEHDGPPPLTPGKGGTVESFSRSPDRLNLKVRANSQALLIVTEQFNRFWKAEIDGMSTPVHPVNGPFMAVSIPEGIHSVAMRYDPPYSIRSSK